MTTATTGVRPFDWAKALHAAPLEAVPEAEQKLVTAAAYALLMHAPGSARKGRGWTFFASAEGLALSARMSRRSMIKALGHLRDAGFLVLVARGGGRRVKLASTYQLAIPGPETGAQDALITVTETGETSAPRAQVNGHQRLETSAQRAQVSDGRGRETSARIAETSARGAHHWSTNSTGVLNHPVLKQASNVEYSTTTRPQRLDGCR